MYLIDTYNGIPFDNINSECRVSRFSDENSYYFNSSEALIARAGEVEYCFMNRLNPQLNTVGEKIEMLIPLKRAAGIVSESLTDYLTFKANEVSLVYTMRQTETKSVSECRPNWRFTLSNENDDRTYVCYVDAIDGRMFYYIIYANTEE